MTRAQIRTVTCALFHDGIDMDKLSDEAKAELREAAETLLSISSAVSDMTKDRT